MMRVRIFRFSLSFLPAPTTTTCMPTTSAAVLSVSSFIEESRVGSVFFALPSESAFLVIRPNASSSATTLYTYVCIFPSSMEHGNLNLRSSEQRGWRRRRRRGPDGWLVTQMVFVPYIIFPFCLLHIIIIIISVKQHTVSWPSSVSFFQCALRCCAPRAMVAPVFGAPLDRVTSDRGPSPRPQEGS